MSYRLDGYFSPQKIDDVDGLDASLLAQDALGADSMGGNVIISSGSGTNSDGYVKLQVGGQDLLVLDGYVLNISIFQEYGSYGGGMQVIFIANSTAPPLGNPVGGGILYVENGALKYKGTSGTVTVLGPA